MSEEVPTFEEVKKPMSKVQQFFENQKQKFNAHMKGYEDHLAKKQDSIKSSVDNFISVANSNIDKMDKKFSGMYNILLREILHKMENRVYTNELSSQALITLLSKRLYKIETELHNIRNPELAYESFESYVAGLKAEYEAGMLSEHNKREEDENQKNVEQNKEVVEKPVEEQQTEQPTV